MTTISHTICHYRYQHMSNMVNLCLTLACVEVGVHVARHTLGRLRNRDTTSVSLIFADVTVSGTR